MALYVDTSTPWLYFPTIEHPLAEVHGLLLAGARLGMALADHGQRGDLLERQRCHLRENCKKAAQRVQGIDAGRYPAADSVRERITALVEALDRVAPESSRGAADNDAQESSVDRQAEALVRARTELDQWRTRVSNTERLLEEERREAQRMHESLERRLQDAMALVDARDEVILGLRRAIARHAREGVAALPEGQE